jgi:hypothetical protein
LLHFLVYLNKFIHSYIRHFTRVYSRAITITANLDLLALHRWAYARKVPNQEQSKWKEETQNEA